MGRLIALGPGGKAQAPARDDRCRPVIEVVLAMGWLDRLLISPRLKTREAADELRRALYRSCRYYCSCGEQYCTRKYPNAPADASCPAGGQRVSCTAEIVVKRQGNRRDWHVQFRLFDKREATREMIKKYGADPNKWPYFAKRKQLREKG